MRDEERYYRAMLNALYGLMDDLDANGAPQSAKEILDELIEVCKADFEDRFKPRK